MNNKNYNKKKKFSKFSRKLNYCAPSIWKKLFLYNQNNVFKFSERLIFCRSSAIPHGFKHLLVKIYSGKTWYVRAVNKWNVGFKFGELTWNRKLALFKVKQVKKKKK